MDYTGKVVIVTGGTKGIGLGCVRAFVDALPRNAGGKLMRRHLKSVR